MKGIKIALLGITSLLLAVSFSSSAWPGYHPASYNCKLNFKGQNLKTKVDAVNVFMAKGVAQGVWKSEGYRLKKADYNKTQCTKK